MAKLRKTNLYYIQGAIGSPVKIGISDDVSKRLGDLQVANYQKLNVLLIVKGCFNSLERQIHRLYKDDRYSGEWFDSSILDHFLCFPDLFKQYGIYDEILLFGYYEKKFNDIRLEQKVNLRDHWLYEIISNKELICA